MDKPCPYRVCLNVGTPLVGVRPKKVSGCCRQPCLATPTTRQKKRPPIQEVKEVREVRDDRPPCFLVIIY